MAQGLAWQEGLGLFNRGEMPMKSPQQGVTCSSSFGTGGDTAGKTTTPKEVTDQPA